MVLSMTGYGRQELQLHGRSICVELRSVNNRYFEYSSRMPRSFAAFDEDIKKAVNARVSRGKIECSLQVRDLEGQDMTIAADIPLAKSYLDAIHSIAAALNLREDVNIGSLLRFPDILTAVPAQLDEEQLRADILLVVSGAVDCFVAMRSREGEKMQEDILSRLSFLEEAVGKVEQGSAQRLQSYRDRLFARLTAILEDKNIKNIEESRILTEAAIFADKTAVDEETVRLRSHIRQYRDILAAGGPVGKKLDFLTQELNRETNTIGSKCQDIEITRVVVDMKAEIEKIREQIQNLE